MGFDYSYARATESRCTESCHGGLGGKLGDNGEASKPWTEFDDLTPRVRAGMVVFHLCRGEGLSTQAVVDVTGLDRSNAWRLMCALSIKLPIYQDDDGVWQLCAMRELDIIQ